MRWFWNLFRPDGTVKVTVNVTQEIIDRSDGRNSRKCMLYNALLPLCPALHRVGVTRFWLRDGTEYDLPEWVSSIVLAHFRGFRAKPFKFKLRLPKECVHVEG